MIQVEILEDGNYADHDVKPGFIKGQYLKVGDTIYFPTEYATGLKNSGLVKFCESELINLRKGSFAQSEVTEVELEEDEAEFEALIEKRRKEKPYCDRRVRIQLRFRPGECVFIVQDEGPGFDISTVPDPTDPVNVERVCGRGMLLMRTFMDELQYNEQGNQVRLVKRRPTRDPS